MKNIFKLGFGPMSKEIIDLLIEYSNKNNFPLMIICSRNQVDYTGGYVVSTEYFSSKVENKSNILLCRDHCGPYFKDSDKELSLDDTITQCKKTIEVDINNNFDLIHVDVSKVNASNQLEIAAELINFALDMNPDILFEFGSEENTGSMLEETFSRLNSQIEFCKKYKNIKFFVTQTGSFIKDKQIGNFNLQKNKIISNIIHSHGFLFKEHNGDYLSTEDIRLRKQAGIDAINIAPQLGTTQTKLLFELFHNTENWNNFYKVVLEGKKYSRWQPNKNTDELLSVLVSGHYFFNTKEYFDLISSVNFINLLRPRIFSILDSYRVFNE